MTTPPEVLRPIRCVLCSWITHSQDPVAREDEWQAHYYGVHPQPLVTRCTVPPYCGWSGTADTLPALRRLRVEHEATHAPPTTKKSKPRRRSTR